MNQHPKIALLLALVSLGVAFGGRSSSAGIALAGKNSQEEVATVRGKVIVQHTLSRFCVLGIEVFGEAGSPRHLLALRPDKRDSADLSDQALGKSLCDRSFVGRVVLLSGSYNEEKKTDHNVDIRSLYGALRYALFQEGLLARSDEFPESIPYFCIAKLIDEAP